MPNRLLASLVALALLAAACGGGGDDDGATAIDESMTTTITVDGDGSTTTSSTSSTLPAGPPTTRGPAPELNVQPMGSLGSITLLSGANLVHAALLRRQDMIDLGAQSRSEYFRSPDRPGTYDLMSEATTLFGIAENRGSGPPPPHFEYRNAEVGLLATAVPASTLTVSFPSVTATWDWDAAAAGWARTQGSSEHVDAQGERVIAANVLVAEVRDVATGSVDTAGSTVFEQQFLGSGRGWVFTDGHVGEVTWTKPSIRSVATWTTADGVPVALVPGITWIELAREGTTTFS